MYGFTLKRKLIKIKTKQKKSGINKTKRIKKI